MSQATLLPESAAKLAAAVAALEAIGLSLQEVSDIARAENLVDMVNEDETDLDDAHEQWLDMAFDCTKDDLRAARAHCKQA